MIALQPFTRRIVYVVTFELLAIAFSTGVLMALSGGGAKGSLPVAIAVSLIAVTWNYIYNVIFENWERRSGHSGRTLAVRLWHTIGFEAGLFLFTIPLYMLWYSVGLWVAFKMEVVILLFFLIYTFVFTWLFDTIFALPYRIVSS